jgi:alpha-ketoglutarate-dependent taurine dioxygenase
VIRSVTVDLPEILDAEAVAQELACALEQAKVVHFRGQPFSNTSLLDWQKVAEGIGTVMRNGEDSTTGIPNGDVWVDVRYRPEHQYTFRHSNTAQPLHTDDAYKSIKDSSNYVLFLIQEAATEGGETYFVDAADLAGYLRQHDPVLFEKLCTLPVTFSKRVEGKTSVVLKPTGDDWNVTWNYYNVDPGCSAEVLALREQFQALLCSEETKNRLAYGFRLGSSEGVIWHDHKVLHGRSAFSASERIIWKCCIR